MLIDMKLPRAQSSTPGISKLSFSFKFARRLLLISRNFEILNFFIVRMDGRAFLLSITLLLLAPCFSSKLYVSVSTHGGLKYRFMDSTYPLLLQDSDIQCMSLRTTSNIPPCSSRPVLLSRISGD